MRTAILVFTILVLSGCGESTQQRFTDCRSFAERVALENISPDSLFPAPGGDARQQAAGNALIELETQRAAFMTVVHEQRMALGSTKVNRYAQRYLAAYGDCRKIDAGNG
jgi:hypothetical protein